MAEDRPKRCAEEMVVIRAFARIYPRGKSISLTEALNILMEEICRRNTRITEEMLAIAQGVVDGERGTR